MDDEPFVLRTVEGLLRRLGYEFVGAAHGQEAIQFYSEALQSENPFSAVILDLTIPGGTGGKDTVTALRKIDPGLRCVVTSGYSHDQVLSRYREYGFQEVLRKPYTLKEIGEILSRLVRA